jgi:hypothetical protein
MKLRVAVALALALLVSGTTARAQSAKSGGRQSASAKSLGTADKLAAQAEQRRTVPKRQSKHAAWAKGGSWGASNNQRH